MKRFELMDASSCLGPQYFVEDRRNKVTYYHGDSFQAACEIVSTLESCKPVWQARPYRSSVWLYATLGDLQAARSVSVSEMAYMMRPDLYLCSELKVLEAQLHKTLAEQARAGR